MSESVTYALANVGRGPNGADEDAVRAMFDAMPEERWVILWCEVNEGDKNDELTLAKRLAPKGTRFYCQATREPIALSPDWPRARSRVMWVEGTSVPHWSPQRSLNIVHLPGEPTTVLGGHYAAGAYHGDRPAAAKVLLRHSWDNLERVHRNTERRLHARGRNVVWLMDTNNDRHPLMAPHEMPVVHDVTDHGRVLAAPGQVARFKELPQVDFRVDSHDGQRMRGYFTDAA